MGDDLARDVEDALVLSDLVSRVLDRGVSVSGDVTISVAGVDLVHLGLRLDLWAVETARRLGLPVAGRSPRSDEGG